jgi:hypothetical protein
MLLTLSISASARVLTCDHDALQRSLHPTTAKGGAVSSRDPIHRPVRRSACTSTWPTSRAPSARSSELRSGKRLCGAARFMNDSPRRDAVVGTVNNQRLYFLAPTNNSRGRAGGNTRISQFLRIADGCRSHGPPHGFLRNGLSASV